MAGRSPEKTCKEILKRSVKSPEKGLSENPEEGCKEPLTRNVKNPYKACKEL